MEADLKDDLHRPDAHASMLVYAPFHELSPFSLSFGAFHQYKTSKLVLVPLVF